MIINFVANFQNGYVGEIGDATHLAREMKLLGHTIRCIPQDEWREYIIEDCPKGKYPNVPEDLTADLNIICKWHHFYDGRFIKTLRVRSKGNSKLEPPVFYWVWDYMWDQGLPQWHIEAIKEADLYLGNDVRAPYYKDFTNCYYFPFDVADGELPHNKTGYKKYDVVFFGSCIGQGNRISWLTKINKTNPVTIFAWNYEDWIKRGFTAFPPRYGIDFIKTVGESKIILGFSVEPNCWGYWSNRVGKILTAGGFLLYQYAPGMELFLRDGVEYFSSIEEAREKIDHFLIAEVERNTISLKGLMIGQERFTSKARVIDLMIMAERYIKTRGTNWQI